MLEYFEHLINAAYRIYQDILIKEHGDIYPLRSAIIKFGGFHLSYNWYGRTLLGKEEVGDLIIYTKEIHLNSLFAYSLAGLKSDMPNFSEHFGFRKSEYKEPSSRYPDSVVGMTLDGENLEKFRSDLSGCIPK